MFLFIFPSGSGYWILTKWALSNFANKLSYGELEKIFMWPCSDVVLVDKIAF